MEPGADISQSNGDQSGANDPTWLRLGAGIVLAPLVLAAMLTLAAYLIAAMGEVGRASAMARTREAGWVFFSFLPLFSVTVGATGVFALRRLKWRSGFSWSVMGAVLGAVSAAGLGLASAHGVAGNHVAIFAVIGLCLFALIRLFAGVKAHR